MADEENHKSLPIDIIARIFNNLSPNEQAVTCRLVSKDFHSLSPGRISLHKPVPSYAFQRWYAHNAPSMTYRYRSSLFGAICASGSIDNLKILLLARCPWDANCFCAAAGADQQHVLEWLLLEGCPISESDAGRLIVVAARSGSHTTLRWTARVFRAQLNKNVFNSACRGEHSEWKQKVEWLLENGCQCEPGALVVAASNGRLDIMQFLHSKGLQPPPKCHEAAIGVNRVDICLWLEERGVEIPADAAVRFAVAYGHLAALRWLVEERGCRLATSSSDSALLRAAASSGDIAILSYIMQPRIGREHPGAEAMGEALLAAARAGHLTMVRHLVESHNAPLSARVAAAVAGVSGLTSEATHDACAEVLEWLHGRGCPIDTWAVVASLRVGNLAAADVAFRAVPFVAFREVAMLDLTRGGSLDVMRWLAAHGGLMGGTSIMEAAAACGDLAKVQWLHEMRCDWAAGVFTEAASSGNLELLSWLARHMCPMGRDGAAYMRACFQTRSPDWATLQRLHELGCPWGEDTFMQVTLRIARKPWAMELLEWMVAHGCPCDAEAISEAAAETGRGDLAARLRQASAQACCHGMSGGAVAAIHPRS